MGNSGFFRTAGIGMTLVGVGCGVVALVPAARTAVGCGAGEVCEPLLRGGGGIVATTFLLIGAIWFAVSFLGSAGRKRATRLRRTGATAPGQVLEISPTGTLINGIPRVELVVRVDGPSGAFVVRDRTQLPAYGGIHVGSAVVVHYDPANPGDFVLSPVDVRAISSTI